MYLWIKINYKYILTGTVAYFDSIDYLHFYASIMYSVNIMLLAWEQCGAVSSVIRCLPVEFKDLNTLFFFFLNEILCHCNALLCF